MIYVGSGLMEGQQNIKNTPLYKLATELSDKLSDIKTTMDEAKGVATIFGKMDGKYLSIVIEQREGVVVPFVESVKVIRKSDYKEEVKKLHAAGFKQREIADRLNMSQPLVSKLLNSN